MVWEISGNISSRGASLASTSTMAVAREEPTAFSTVQRYIPLSSTLAWLMTRVLPTTWMLSARSSPTLVQAVVPVPDTRHLSSRLSP